MKNIIQLPAPASGTVMVDFGSILPKNTYHDGLLKASKHFKAISGSIYFNH